MKFGFVSVTTVALSLLASAASSSGAPVVYMHSPGSGFELPLDIASDVVIHCGNADLQQTLDTVQQRINALTQAHGPQITDWAAIANDNGDGTPLYHVFDGQNVDTNSILIRYTLNGDVNLDRVINFNDFYQINAGFLSHGSKKGYRWGDFNGDGRINFEDFFLINTAFLNQSHASFTESSAVFVPLPGAAVAGLILLALMLALRLARRRQVA